MKKRNKKRHYIRKNRTWVFYTPPRTALILYKPKYCLILYLEKPCAVIIYIKKQSALIIFKKKNSKVIILRYGILFWRKGILILVYHTNNITYFTNNFITFYWDNLIYINYKFYAPSLLFRKIYNEFYTYLDYESIILKKYKLHFISEKTRLFIEYQSNFKHYQGNMFNIFTHLYEYTISCYILISSIKLSLYIFDNNKESPREKILGFIRLKENSVLGNIKIIKALFDQSILNYSGVIENEYYQDTYSLNHISLRLYFQKKTVPGDKLIMRPFFYYQRVNKATTKFLNVLDSKSLISNFLEEKSKVTTYDFIY